MTIDEIDQKLPQLETSTIRYAIRRLLEAKIIQSVPELLDMRTVRYRLTPKSQLGDALEQLPKDIVVQLKPFLQEGDGEKKE